MYVQFTGCLKKNCLRLCSEVHLTRPVRALYHNNDKGDIVELKGLKGSVRLRRMKPCGRDRVAKRGKDPPRSTPSQFFQESVSMRQL